MPRQWSRAEEEYLLEKYHPAMPDTKQKKLAEKLFRQPDELQERYNALSASVRPQNVVTQGNIGTKPKLPNMSRIMSANEAIAAGEAPPRNLPDSYTRSKQAWRTIGGKRHFYRSKWEQNIACYLQTLQTAGHLTDWHYEPDTFWYHQISRGIRSYTPDFRLHWKKQGLVEYWEVKGIMDSKSRTKIKRLKKYYPDVKLKVIGKREYSRISKNAHYIAGWI